jgi:hypothetical protein
MFFGFFAQLGYISRCWEGHVGSLAESRWVEIFRNMESAGEAAKPIRSFLLDRFPPQYDTQLTNLVVQWLGNHPFTFAFVYLGYTDIVGHDQGQMSPY